jgi:type II secretory pathway component PulM
MGNKLKEAWTSFTDRITQAGWFQQLKAKWEELDPQSRLYLKAGGGVAAVLLTFTLVGTSLWSVHKLKVEYTEKQELLNTIQTAYEELRRLRDSTSGAAAAGGAATQGGWQGYLETLAGTSGIDKAAMTISSEKSGAATDTAKESLFDVSIKHVGIKQVIRLTHAIESGNRPVKLRNLTIETQSDPQGYLNATLSLSGFALVSK